MDFKLGKKDPVPGRVSFKYRDIFNIKKLQRPPRVFGHVWNETVIDMLGNDECGDCVWATQAHILNTMQRGANHPETHFTKGSVVSDYSALTGYIPGDPKTDQGTMMADAASYWRKVGILDGIGKRHQIDAYVEIKLHDVDELMQATFDFGAVALGVQLPQSASEQWDDGRPWTHSPFSGRKILGGHATALVGRNSEGMAIIATWNGITAATMDWIKEYQDEALAFISLDYLDEKGVNPRGYDRAELEKRLEALT